MADATALQKQIGYVKAEIEITMELFSSEAFDGFGFQRNIQRAKNELLEYSNDLAKLWDLIRQGEADEFIDFHRSSKNFYYRVETQLVRFEAQLKESTCSDVSPAPSSNTDSLPLTALPKLNCPVFSGNERDKFAFKNFLTQFNNMVANVQSDSLKLQYLKNNVKGYPLALIERLSMTDENFSVAIDLLKKEYLDLGLIKSQIFSHIIEADYIGHDLEAAKNFLTSVRADVLELKSSYNLDFLEKDSAGAEVLGHVVFSKLPNILRRELINLEGTNYPSIDFMLDNFSEIIKKIQRTSKQTLNKPPLLQKETGRKFERANKPCLQNYFAGSRPKQGYKCVLCPADGHSLTLCHKYPSPSDKISRCKELNLCHHCGFSGHGPTECRKNLTETFSLCNSCKKRSHFWALCPKKDTKTSTNTCMCPNEKGSDILLPLLEVVVNTNGQNCKLNCLFDSGSQRSYISGKMASALKMPFKNLPKVVYNVKTFLNECTRTLGEMQAQIQVGSNTLACDLLVDDSLNLDFSVARLASAIENLRSAGFVLAADYSNMSGDMVKVDGIIGNDLIQDMEERATVNCVRGTAYKVSTGIIPFGDISRFLPSEETNIRKLKSTERSYSAVVEPHSNRISTWVNFVLEPKPFHADILDATFEFSSVERNLEKMFSVESVGIQEDSWSNYDEVKIGKFQKSIVYENQCYYVDIPWDEDKIARVPSNHAVSLGVLNRVVDSLDKRGLLKDYTEVFLEQEKEGIIERIEVAPENYEKFTWIPHRPVVKENEQCSTKIRPVFNCSLKVRGAPSLNEAVYPGINLINNLLDLLIYFRSNKEVFLADIRKAFLMIKLRTEKDKNRFCFFMRVGSKLLCYRYTTLIFGFVASPFILNFLIQHHLKKYNDLCAEKLKTRFYVDNLVVTSNTSDALMKDYRSSVEIMAEGNFHLRSCNSNSLMLRKQMVADGTFVDHDSDLERMLGYNYCVQRDVIKLIHKVVDPLAKTKRKILAQIAGVFDPLSLCLPVTVRGKLLMRDLWNLGLGWDQLVPDDKGKEWERIAQELSLLSDIELPRCAFRDDLPTSIFVFCDASRLAYGCAMYLVQDGTSNLLFAKTKVAPMKEKTLPTLELLAVYLAVKCLKLVLKSVSHTKIDDLFLAVDAQVVLAWLFASRANVKNTFVNNRLKDINLALEEVTSTYGVNVRYKYVPTLQNPADLITRGLTFKKFKDCLEFWVHGPAWLCSIPVAWPENDLKCLTEEDKRVVQTRVQCSTISDTKNCVVAMNKFSKLIKLVRVVTFIFKFVNNLKKKDSDPAHDAKVHLLKSVQQQHFDKEIKFLRDNKVKDAPKLVKDLALFIDDDGLIRSKARIDKVNDFTFEVKNPILLPKYSHFTGLVIREAHERCKHLGISASLSQLRLSGYWIPQARQSVKFYLANCFVCKRYNSLSFKYPKLTNLPKHRVNLVRPFLHTGVDFTGHLWVQREVDTKVYLLVFTCLNIRAVHIELLEDMSVRSFVFALVRFSNLYGVPEFLYSDNARSFIAGCNLVNKFLQSDEYLDRFGHLQIKHLTIPFYSPWMGSVWERMIRTIKGCLYKTIGRAKMKYHELLTLLSDIQRAINSRPLTYRCSSDSGLDLISPINFICPYAREGLLLKTLSDQNVISDPPARSDLVSSLESRDLLLEKFHKLWYEDYLVSLREQCKELSQQDFENHVRVDDIVIIKNPAKPRPYWPLGRVVELIVGDDGNVRTAKVKKGDGSLQMHSVKHLYPMELSLTHNHQARDVVAEAPPAPVTPISTVTNRPKRTNAGKRKTDSSDPYIWYGNKKN